MKKIMILAFTALFFCAAAFSQVINNSQIIEGKHWIYDAFETLSMESKTGNFSSNTPLTVGELKLHFKEYNRQALSESGKAVYDKVNEFLFTQKNLFPGKMFELGLGLKLAPELCYKSNDQIDWTYNYYFNDNPISAQIDSGISDYFSVGADFFIGKNYRYSNDGDNLTNLPLGYNQFEFLFPRFCYGSLAAVFDGWGLGVSVGKEGLCIGNTKTGSIIYNNTFETDGYFQFNAYTDDVKYTMDIVQIQPEKFLYWHEFDVRFFKKIKFGIMEGSLVNKPLELRFLNPLMIFHSFAFWKDFTNETEDHYYNEGYCCSYLGLTFEILPVKNLRIYGLYAMNEIQLPNEQTGKWLSYPDSLGGQLGMELKIPHNNGGYWKGVFESVYCSPFLYIKQSPDWSLYRARTDNITWDTVNSWIGSPFGPDTFAVNASVSYEKTDKWEAGFEYLLLLKGENGFSLFDKDIWNTELGYKDYSKEKIWTYYPYTKYMIAEDAPSQKGMDSAISEGRNMWMSGCCEYTHRFTLNGSVNITPKFTVKGQVVYSFVLNASHIKDNFQHGVQGALSLEYRFF